MGDKGKIMDIGKFVRVISDASYKHYKKIGRITKFCKNPDMIYVYFSGDKHAIRFYKSSLELLN